MKFEKQYKFETWNEWDHIIHISAEDFFNQFHFYPNYLLGNQHTFSQIDFIANMRPDMDIYKVEELTGKEYVVEKEKQTGIGIFTDKQCGFEIQFCIEEELADKEFNLIYDDEPDEDDEDVPIENTPSELAFA